MGSRDRRDTGTAHSGVARTPPTCFVSAFRGAEKDHLTYASIAEATARFSNLGFFLAKRSRTIQDPPASGVLFSRVMRAYRPDLRPGELVLSSGTTGLSFNVLLTSLRYPRKVDSFTFWNSERMARTFFGVWLSKISFFSAFLPTAA